MATYFVMNVLFIFFRINIVENNFSRIWRMAGEDSIAGSNEIIIN